MSNPIKEIVDVVEDVVDTIVDVIKDIVNDVVDLIKDVWEDVAPYVSTAMAAIAIATGQWYLVASGIITLDYQYNDGELTSKMLEFSGDIEKAILGTEYIDKYSQEIELALMIASSIGVGYATGMFLSEIPELASTMAFLKSSMVSATMGAYTTYEAYNQYEAVKDYYAQQLEEYREYLKQAQQRVNSFRNMWFDVYGDLGNMDLLYEASAGGNLFNAGAGSSEYSPSTIHEPAGYILAYDIKKDSDLDTMIFDNSNYDHIKLNI